MNGEKSILLQELCLLINIIISFGIPFLGVGLISKKFGIKTRSLIKPFLIGMITFVISQVLTRIPIISLVLPNFTWYLTIQHNPYLYGVFLGFTAGIFEEVGRLIFMKLCLKNRTKIEDGLAFGLGHGGIEAILFVGINSLVTMIINPMELVDLSDTGYLTILTAGLERVFAMTFHVGATLIVLYGIKEQKVVRYTALAVLLHGLLDCMVVILPAVIGLGPAGIEIYAMIIAIIVLVLGIFLYYHKGHNTQLITQ